MCKSCRPCFKFYCMFYFTCARSFRTPKMCRHCTLVPILRLIALILLAIAVAACLIGFVSPFWAYYDPGLPCVSTAGNASLTAASTAKPAVLPTTAPPRAAEYEGLWGRCYANNFTLCTWFWDNNFELERCFPSTCFMASIHLFHSY